MGSQSTSVLVYKRCEISTKTVDFLETKFSKNHLQLQVDCHGFGKTLSTCFLYFQKNPNLLKINLIAKSLTKLERPKFV